MRVRNSANATVGYVFNNPAYLVGNYPDSGSRGFRSVTANQTAQGTFNVLNFQYPAVWTAALNSNYIGRSINVLFDAASTTNRIIVFHDNNDPYFGTGCRCVKIKYDANGNEEGPASGISFISNRPALMKENVKSKAVSNKISIYPSPFSNILYISTTENKEYNFQIFNVLGQLVKVRTFYQQSDRSFIFKRRSICNKNKQLRSSCENYKTINLKIRD